MTATILPHALPSALDQFDGLKVLSLDCFDTLLWRDSHAPQDIFALLPGTTSLQRRWAEGRARKAARIGMDRADVSIGEIYAQLLPNADAAERNVAIAAELAAEARHCHAFAPTVALMREARARGLQVVIVSDTYLDAGQLRELIARSAGDEVAGLIDRLFCSSTYGKPKAGGLYGDVLRKLKAKPHEILHIGDNLAADVGGVAPFGINTLHLVQFSEAAEERLRHEAAVSALLHDQGGEGVTALLPHRAALAIADPLAADPAENFGLSVLGPVLYGFERWLRAEAEALQAARGGTVHWLFLMRDGHLPRLVHEAAGDGERGHAIEISRFCGPTFVSVPIDDWLKPTRPLAARQVTRTIGPDLDAIRALAAAIDAGASPALVIGPGVDRAQAVDLAVKVAERSRSAVWVSPFSARCSFPERHPQFAGFLHASPGQLSDALGSHDLVVTIGAPVFTFHVEGEATVFDGGATLWQITDDATAAATTPVGSTIVASLAPALSALLTALPEPRRATPKGRTLPEVPKAADPIPVEYLLHSLSAAMPADAALVEEAPSHRPAMQKFLPMRGEDSFYTMASGGLGWSLPAAVGLALGRPARRTVCLIGDGSAMYSIQALWTAAQRRLPLTVVVINNGGYGAMRSFSQVMQVRNVPGLDLPGIDFVRIAEGLGCHAVRVSRAAELPSALAQGLAHDGVSLVEVMVDGAVPILYGQQH